MLLTADVHDSVSGLMANRWLGATLGLGCHQPVSRKREFLNYALSKVDVFKSAMLCAVMNQLTLPPG